LFHIEVEIITKSKVRLSKIPITILKILNVFLIIKYYFTFLKYIECENLKPKHSQNQLSKNL